MDTEDQREISSPEPVRIERGVGEESGSGNYDEESSYTSIQVSEGSDSEEGSVRRGSHPVQEEGSVLIDIENADPPLAVEEESLSSDSSSSSSSSEESSESDSGSSESGRLSVESDSDASGSSGPAGSGEPSGSGGSSSGGSSSMGSSKLKKFSGKREDFEKTLTDWTATLQYAKCDEFLSTERHPDLPARGRAEENPTKEEKKALKRMERFVGLIQKACSERPDIIMMIEKPINPLVKLLRAQARKRNSGRRGKRASPRNIYLASTGPRAGWAGWSWAKLRTALRWRLENTQIHYLNRSMELKEPSSIVM